MGLNSVEGNYSNPAALPPDSGCGIIATTPEKHTHTYTRETQHPNPKHNSPDQKPARATLPTAEERESSARANKRLRRAREYSWLEI